MLQTELNGRPKTISAPRHNPEMVPEAQESRLMRIVIAGHLKPGHVMEINESYGKLFDLRVWKHDESPHKLISMCRSVDKVLLLTQGIGHKTENALQAAGIKYERVPGNVGVLKHRLSELYAAV